MGMKNLKQGKMCRKDDNFSSWLCTWEPVITHRRMRKLIAEQCAVHVLPLRRYFRKYGIVCFSQPHQKCSHPPNLMFENYNSLRCIVFFHNRAPDGALMQLFLPYECLRMTNSRMHGKDLT